MKRAKATLSERERDICLLYTHKSQKQRHARSRNISSSLALGVQSKTLLLGSASDSGDDRPLASQLYLEKLRSLYTKNVGCFLSHRNRSRFFVRVFRVSRCCEAGEVCSQQDALTGRQARLDV